MIRQSSYSYHLHRSNLAADLRAEDKIRLIKSCGDGYYTGNVEMKAISELKWPANEFNMSCNDLTNLHCTQIETSSTEQIKADVIDTKGYLKNLKNYALYIILICLLWGFVL